MTPLDRFILIWIALALSLIAAPANAAMTPTPITEYAEQKLQLTPFESPSAGIDSIVAIIINFKGQSLKGESNDLEALETRSGTITEFLSSVTEPYKYELLLVENKKGEVLGLVLAQEGMATGFTLFEDQNTLLMDVDESISIGDAGEGGGGGTGGQ